MQVLKHFLLPAGLLIALFISSCYRNDMAPVEVVKDCTGTYVKMGESDYKVCNVEKLDSYENGTAVLISYELMDSCDNPNLPPTFCELYHPYEGWVNITELE